MTKSCAPGRSPKPGGVPFAISWGGGYNVNTSINRIATKGKVR
jgi:hypothetical protein